MPIWPIAVHALAGSACGVALWRHAGELRATVVVKGSFRMVPDGPMDPIEPQAVLRADEHHSDSPAKSLKRSRELAPYRPQCDVTLHGQAHAPAGQAVPAASARLALFRDDRGLVDRTVHVFGDRALGRDGVPGPPEPFTSMPLDYELAQRSDSNPNGVNPAKQAPNLVDEEQPDGAAGGFGPISRYAKLRRELLGGTDRKALEADIAEVPEGFDWAYFQSAPLAQQCDGLAGSEWVILDGLNAAKSRLASQLPEIRAEACVVALSPEGAESIAADLPLRFVPIPLVADGLHIDADAAEVTVTWRGNVVVSSKQHL
ncbi:MAG: hypothetical protein DRI90_03410, partial [Deltaproteobacteria bacterium]